MAKNDLKPNAAGPSNDDATANAEGGSTLRRLFVLRYADLRRRLVRRLGSSEWADDALHDTYVRLAGTDAVSTVRDPGAYLFRAAFHTALDQRRAENRRLSKADIEALLHIADEAPGPERIVESRNEVASLASVMAKLPPRRRAILLAARLDGMSRSEIAEQFGISVSMVEQDLRAAQEYCAARLKRKTDK